MSAPPQSAGDDFDRQVTRERLAAALAGAALRLRRGDQAGALTDCQAVLAVDPENLDARELLGDILAAQGNWDAAIAQFRSILAAEPSRVAAERKLAESSLGRAGLRDAAFRADQATGDRKPGIASLLSFLFPGMGQFYNRETRKAVGIVAGALALAFTITRVLFIVPMRVAEAAARGSHAEAPKEAARYAQALANMSTGMKALLIAACVLWLCLHIWSIFDAARGARRPVSAPRPNAR